MGWGNYWNPKTGSVQTYAPPVPQQPAGLPADWKNYSAGTTPFWGIKDNPLWEVAAEANGIDFDSLVARIDSELGTKEDWADMQPVVEEGGGDPFAAALPSYFGSDESTEGDTGQYDTVAFELAMEEYRNNEDNDADGVLSLFGLDTGRPQLSDFPINAINKYGFTNYGHHDLAGKLGELDGWMTNSIKAFKNSDYDIIRKGPSGFDYGYDQENIFAALGLDKAPEAPKALNVSYEMNLAEAKTSNATYKTPAGYTKVNLHEA